MNVGFLGWLITDGSWFFAYRWNNACFINPNVDRIRLSLRHTIAIRSVIFTLKQARGTIIITVLQ